MYCGELKKLPKKINILTNLKKLKISGRNLKYIPKEIGNLVNLKELEIIRLDKLNKLPKELFNLLFFIIPAIMVSLDTDGAYKI